MIINNQFQILQNIMINFIVLTSNLNRINKNNNNKIKIMNKRKLIMTNNNKKIKIQKMKI